MDENGELKYGGFVEITDEMQLQQATTIGRGTVNPYKAGTPQSLAYEEGYKAAVTDVRKLVKKIWYGGGLKKDGGDYAEERAAGRAGQGGGRDGSMLAGREEIGTDDWTGGDF